MCLTPATTQSFRTCWTKEGTSLIGLAVSLQLDLQHLRHVGYVALPFPILLWDWIRHTMARDVFIPRRDCRSSYSRLAGDSTNLFFSNRASLGNSPILFHILLSFNNCTFFFISLKSIIAFLWIALYNSGLSLKCLFILESLSILYYYIFKCVENLSIIVHNFVWTLPQISALIQDLFLIFYYGRNRFILFSIKAIKAYGTRN